MKHSWLLIVLLLINCTSNKRENFNPKSDESNGKEQLADPLLLDGRLFVGFQGKEYRRDEAGLIVSLSCNFNPDAIVRWHSLEGAEQLINLKNMRIYGENLAGVDFSPLSSLSYLESLCFYGISHLPDLTILEQVTYISIDNLRHISGDIRLESLVGIGAPNTKEIEIDGVRIDSLAPLNNLHYLEDLIINGRGSTALKIADMSNLPSLKNLRLYMPSTTIDLQGIEKMSALEKLWVSQPSTFNIEGIGKLGNLQRLYLKLESREPSLEFLRNMPNLTDLGIIANVDNFDAVYYRLDPYQVLDVSPLATLRNLRVFGCTDFIIKNIAALDVLDALSIQDDESLGYIYLAGCRLYNETDKSRHPLVLDRPAK